MFSTITMALSTNMPRTSTKLNSTIMFSVRPSAWTRKNVISMLSGMIMATIVLDRQPRNSTRTPVTRIKAARMLFSKSATVLRTYFDIS